ncbi:unnamed protein product [marine sediment metagenome]|uniref:Uncharacterized protein n=1 Tax=marine sediment metagenome TaxID=412755 RepID=X1TX27_9ZZZZ
MLTNMEVARIIEAYGHGKLPSGCRFVCLNKDMTEQVVIAPNMDTRVQHPMPKVYYLRDEQGQVVAFKAM